MGDPCRGSGARDGGGEVQLKKWSCNACTYENWPRAVRCAMCQVTKDFNPKGSRNIYELAFVNQDLNPHNKWSCHACTYLNWPKAVRCTQCQRNRSSSPPSPQTIVHNVQQKQQQSNTSEQIHDPRPNSATGPLMARAEAAARSENQTYPLMIPPWARTGGGGNDGYGSDHHSTNLPSRDHHRGNDGRGGAIEKKRYPKGKVPRSTPSPPPAPSVQMIPSTQSSPSDPDGLDSYFNRININGSSTNSTSTTTTCTKSTLKWSCTICTFENWPKASKCSMCCTPRGNH